MYLLLNTNQKSKTSHKEKNNNLRLIDHTKITNRTSHEEQPKQTNKYLQMKQTTKQETWITEILMLPSGPWTPLMLWLLSSLFPLYTSIKLDIFSSNSWLRIKRIDYRKKLICVVGGGWGRSCVWDIIIFESSMLFLEYFYHKKIVMSFESNFII